ncbi:hypothetical protein JX266_003267 [Neoarthrinium moseri]|nr:hypothetical protein JX266_003267 [Neoarthrinium moseri]
MQKISNHSRFENNERWDAHKDIIEHLYCTLDKPLGEVTQVLREQYDFHATQRMYKARLKKWGFRKYLSKEEFLEAQRQTHSGTAVLPVAQGRQLDSRRLKAAIELANRRRRIGTCAKRLTAPDSIRLPEGALYEMQRYLLVSFEQQRWDHSKFDFFQNATCEWAHDIREAGLQISKRDNRALGFQLIDQCCARFQSVLRQQESLLIWAIHLGIIALAEARNDQAALTLVRFMVGMCSIELGSNHPLTILCARFQMMGIDQVKASFTSMVRAHLEVFRKQLGSTNVYIALARLVVAQWLYSTGLMSFDASLREVRRVFLDLKGSPGGDGDSAFGLTWVGSLLAGWLMASRQYADARAALQDMKQWHRERGLTYDEKELPCFQAIRAAIKDNLVEHNMKGSSPSSISGLPTDHQLTEITISQKSKLSSPTAMMVKSEAADCYETLQPGELELLFHGDDNSKMGDPHLWDIAREYYFEPSRRGKEFWQLQAMSLRTRALEK